jgi:hypothetical protein
MLCLFFFVLYRQRLSVCKDHSFKVVGTGQVVTGRRRNLTIMVLQQGLDSDEKTGLSFVAYLSHELPQ